MTPSYRNQSIDLQKNLIQCLATTLEFVFEGNFSKHVQKKIYPVRNKIWKMFEVHNNENSRQTSITCGVFINNFEHCLHLDLVLHQINASWELINLRRGVYIFMIIYQLRHCTSFVKEIFVLKTLLCKRRIKWKLFLQ